MSQTATQNNAAPPSTHVDRLLQEHFGSQDGQLCMSGVPVSELIGTYGSPLYIYDRSVMKRQLAKVRCAFSDRVDVFYSMKANPSQQVLRYFLSEGCGIEIASAGELEQAVAAGCQAKRILFAGPGKRSEELERAVALGVGEIHVESVAEARRLHATAEENDKVVRISLRINPAESVQGGAMRMGGKPSPFGIDEESLDNVLDTILSLANLDIRGIHLFTGTQILDHNVLITQYRKAIEIAERVATRIPNALESIDFGGGLGIAYFERESPLDLLQFAPLFRDLMIEIDTNPLLTQARLIVEPGRFLVGESGVYVSKVIEVKTSRGKTFAVTDGGMHHHLAASGNLGQTIKRNYPIAAVNRLDGNAKDTTEVVGPLCTPLDVLGRAVKLPQLSVGDLIGVFQSGAYGRSSSPSGFLSHATAAEVIVDDGKHWLIRRRGKSDDYLHHQISPSLPNTDIS